MMKKVKISCCVTILAVLLAFLVCIFAKPHTYTKSDRDSYFENAENSSSAFVSSQGIDTSVKGADIVIQGRVAGIPRKGFLRFTATDPNVTLPDNLGANVIKYKISVNDVWFGEHADNSLTLYLEEHRLQPHINDKLILFLAEAVDPDTGKIYYRTVNSEKSVFAINPSSQTLFAFSNDAVSVQYDGLSSDVLKADIHAKLVEFSQDDRYCELDNVGSVFDTYRSQSQTQTFA